VAKVNKRPIETGPTYVGESRIQWMATVALVKYGDARAVEALVQLLGKPDNDYSSRSAQVVDVLCNALMYPDNIVRERAAFALGTICDARAVKALW